MLDNPLNAKLADIADQLQKVISAHSGEAWELAKVTAQAAAATNLIQGGVLMLTAVLFAWFGAKCCIKAKGTKEYSDERMRMPAAGIALWGAGLGLGLWGLTLLGNMINWMALSNPAIFLAEKVLGL